MNYVCKWLGWWQTEVLVVELKLEPSSHEMVEFLQRVIMARPPDSLTVPIPMGAQMMIEADPRAVYELFMRRLMPLLTRLGTGLEPREQISTALICLVESVRSSSSTPEYEPYFTLKIID